MENVKSSIFLQESMGKKKAFSQNSEAPIQIRTEARATVFFNMTNLIS